MLTFSINLNKPTLKSNSIWYKFSSKLHEIKTGFQFGKNKYVTQF